MTAFEKINPKTSGCDMKKIVLTAFSLCFQIVACFAQDQITPLEIVTTVTTKEVTTRTLAGVELVPSSEKVLATKETKEAVTKIIVDTDSEQIKVSSCSAEVTISPTSDPQTFIASGKPGSYKATIILVDADAKLVERDIAFTIGPVEPQPDDLQALIDAIDLEADKMADPTTRGVLAAGYAAVASALESGGTVSVSYAGGSWTYPVTTIPQAQTALLEKAREAMWNRKDQSKNWFQFRKTASKLTEDAIGASPTVAHVVAVLQAVGKGLSEPTETRLIQQQIPKVITGAWELRQVCYPDGTCRLMRVWVEQ